MTFLQFLLSVTINLFSIGLPVALAVYVGYLGASHRILKKIEREMQKPDARRPQRLTGTDD